MHFHTERDLPERLTQLLSYLHRDFYEYLKSLNEKADSKLNTLLEPDDSPLPLDYVHTSQRLSRHIDQLLRDRKFGALPYVDELMRKEDEGHDCRTCTGPCAIMHGAQLRDLRESRVKIGETLYRLQSARPSRQEMPSDNAAFGELQSLQAQIESTLDELFELEEFSLIPLIIEVQKAIHANA